jgi:hypothetical protein
LGYRAAAPASLVLQIIPGLYVNQMTAGGLATIVAREYASTLKVD